MYFTLSQVHSVVLIVAGGLLLVLVLVAGYWSSQLHLARRQPQEPPTEKKDEAGVPVGGDRPVPLFLILLIVACLAWGIAYVVAVAVGGLNVQ